MDDYVYYTLRIYGWYRTGQICKLLLNNFGKITDSYKYKDGNCYLLRIALPAPVTIDNYNIIKPYIIPDLNPNLSVIET